METRVSDYIMNSLADRGVDTAFLVTGGMAMHLNDALLGEKKITVVCCHHEQAAAFAAEGYGHVTGRPALVSVTAGPGSINALNGVYGAYLDSIPMIVIAGQCKRELLRATYGFDKPMRQIGEQEVDSVSMAAPVTKRARRVTDPARIPYELGKAVSECVSGRPGPVWLEIPVDVQALTIDPEKLSRFVPPLQSRPDLSPAADSAAGLIAEAKRPLIVLGTGVRKAGEKAVDSFHKLAAITGCPIVTSGPQDVIWTDHPQYAGEMGATGTRAGNINVQNADLILFVGFRPYLCLITYNWPSVGRNAIKIAVDEDPTEFEKPCGVADIKIQAEIAPFLSALNRSLKDYSQPAENLWLEDCKKRVLAFPVLTPALRTVTPDGRVNPYFFVHELMARLDEDDVITTGNGSAGLIPIQAPVRKKGQRFFSNVGSGSMGFGLPSGIGAAIASKGRRVVVIDGDGSLMMNLQELQTVIHHNLPLILVLLENEGYASIRQTQRNFFGREIGSGPETGVSCPDFLKVSEAFGFKTFEASGPDFAKTLDAALLEKGPAVIVARIDPNQPFEPK
ncbi:MAG: thiamine pyrophosphate-binding protein, partial [Deltaproteobacteria bacterium]|nr:thiamine pyrophosphate-binding protein [Deltaproteobacteria bacterium]